MYKVIIFPNNDGWLSVGYPAPECTIPIEEIARKDVPAGKPYHIIDGSLIPTDHIFFNAWETDFSNPDGYGIGNEAWFAEQAAKEQAIKDQAIVESV